MAATPLTDALEPADIQGLIHYGYGNLRAARYLLMTITDAGAARRWLRGLIDRIPTAAARSADAALHVAFTAPGLAALGLSKPALAGFSLEFGEGMVTDHRSRFLGDADASAPERWAWGGPQNEAVHMLLLVFAVDWPALAILHQSYAADFAAGGVRQLASLETVDLGTVEHFGFHDGVSQPLIAGLSHTGSPMDMVQPGEFLLGYVNEHGQRSERPLLPAADDPTGVLPKDPDGSGQPDFGRNGSYLVMRQLSQDVRGFWRWADRASGQDGGDASARIALASKMVGRWPSGAPLVLAPDHDDPALADANDFAYYQQDAAGYRCPIGAHVRRANPRDSLDPAPGTEKSIAVGKRHRLLRRGREYGAAVDPATVLTGADDSADRGLHFIAFCAKIARQFEFLQGTWITNPKFGGLYDSDDPLIGARGPQAGAFFLPDQPVRLRHLGLPRFVDVRGGGYFFLPGLRALRYLSEAGPVT